MSLNYDRFLTLNESNYDACFFRPAKGKTMTSSGISMIELVATTNQGKFLADTGDGFAQPA